MDRSTLYRRVEDLREPEELRCRACEVIILAPEVACPSCSEDDPAPVARTAYDEAHAEDPPEPDDHGGLARIGHPTVTPGSLADQQR
ncbi:hypothetical protein ACFWZ2_21510 [Streptomyces sp. NPDC059002]|uniref:hypothetical protein n=1 Tax=Streptomyces sp. NPDC059002 TaxID=3346690 RepID=UPI0036B5D02E